MKTLLVLAKQPGLAEALRAALDPEAYRVIHHQEVWAAEPLFSRAVFDACFLDADLTNVQPVRALEQLRQAAPQCPIFVFASARQWEWEEEAYLLGVEHIFAKPVRSKLLNSILERCWQKAPSRRAAPAAAPMAESRPSAVVWGSSRTLEVLRDFSSILTHSLQTESLLKQFLLLLREVINVNRAAIFLRHPGGVLGAPPDRAGERRMHSACALGLPSALLEHFALSLDAGIGGYAYRHGRILKCGSDEARADWGVQKEFELLGVQVAIPILDREILIGVAVFDGRLTGEFFANEELALIFHLLEGIGLAIKSSWLHDELSSNHSMMADVLSQLEGGCVVVDKNLAVLHANHAAQACFNLKDKVTPGFVFSDLPQALGSKVYEALQTGAMQAPFKYRPPGGSGTVYRVAITPFKRTNSHTPSAVMLLIEDCTQSDRAQQLEIEASSLRLVKSMAERLAHEIGNSLVPIFTYKHLESQNNDDPEIRLSVSNAMDEGLRRIARLSNQMRFLARDSFKGTDIVAIEALVGEAFREANGTQVQKPDQLQFENTARAASVTGDYASLRHALSEVLLNAMQSAPVSAPVRVRAQAVTDREGDRWVQIEVRDEGNGFTSETAEHAVEPFYSKRTVGLGLGLTVARKIVEMHKGRIEIVPQQPDQPGLVRISLPYNESLPHVVKGGNLAAA
jgi:signal transduction histidine kinase/DNA-binding NarL/FixJ family response regulator